MANRTVGSTHFMHGQKMRLSLFGVQFCGIADLVCLKRTMPKIFNLIFCSGIVLKIDQANIHASY